MHVVSYRRLEVVKKLCFYEDCVDNLRKTTCNCRSEEKRQKIQSTKITLLNQSCIVIRFSCAFTLLNVSERQHDITSCTTKTVRNVSHSFLTHEQIRKIICSPPIFCFLVKIRCFVQYQERFDKDSFSPSPGKRFSKDSHFR